MKDRVVNTLKGSAFPERFNCDQAMANQICKDLTYLQNYFRKNQNTLLMKLVIITQD